MERVNAGRGRGRGRTQEGTRQPGVTGPPRRAPLADFIRSRPSNNDFVKQGTSGQPVKVITNHFKFRKDPKFEMTLYGVQTEPEVEEDRKVRQLVELVKEDLGPYMMSGRQLFTTRRITQDILLEYYGAVPDKPEVMYKVKLDFKRVVEEGEPVVIQFYNTVMKQIQRLLKHNLIGGRYFDPDKTVKFPAWHLELWPGFNNCVRQQETDLMLNVDSCWKVLQTESVLRKMASIRRESKSGEDWATAISEALVGKTVVTRYSKRAYKIGWIDYQTTPKTTFEMKDGSVISYVQYYQDKYQVTIQDLQQPMLVSEPRRRDVNRGNTTGDIFLVPELCFLSGLTDELRDNLALMKDLASCFHMPPNKRVEIMKEFMGRAVNNNEIQRTLLAWGIQLGTRPVEVPARLLPSEEIMCGEEQIVKPDDKEEWYNSIRSHKMMSTMKLDNWVIIVPKKDYQNVYPLISTMQKVASPLGYQINQPSSVVTVDNRINTYPEAIDHALHTCKGEVGLVFVILVNDNSETYAAVKNKCSVQYGVPSQCFLSKKLTSQRALMTICTKLVIQMNAKQGGEPWGVKIPLKNTMIMGYDVHHGGPSGTMSVGAMTATVNPTYGRIYSTVARLPPLGQTVAPVVASMLDKCLGEYTEKNHLLPDRIMMYRDGVGDGQLGNVYSQELQAFRDTIRRRYEERGQSLPKLTYIVVNKRGTTRFFTKDHNTFSNPGPGLVVDDVVTREERYDFFLVSQTARQGCVNATYYNVLCDESGLEADKIQLLTYKLCHLYYNWTGTVGRPSPCQNASKLAQLVSTILKCPANSRLDGLLHFL